ncbi:MAG: hypothetical protein IID45_07535 [Planctomycetes bacterium]|nr:hypothetical protein [Planctomycetota bacterium]
MRLASLFTDQVPGNDTGRALSKKYGFPIYPSVAGALTLGSGKLSVDGVMLIAEHGKYPESATGQFQFPKRRLFREVVATFHKSNRVVPVFFDKHLSDNWKDAKWIYDTAKAMKIPMMAGSSLPVLWRYPPVDVQRGVRLKEIVAVSYHRLDTYGFHALEMVQALAERRQGGETGVKSVQCLTGKAVWAARTKGVFDPKLLEKALSRLKERPLPKGRRIEDLVKKPVLFVINYRDGLRACVLTLNYVVNEWAVAWKTAAPERVQSTLFWTQEKRPFNHFSQLLRGVEKMMQTGRPTWPVERTLLTSGTLDALLQSKKAGGKLLLTPHLHIRYSTSWNWQQPPPPPPGRPIGGQ